MGGVQMHPVRSREVVHGEQGDLVFDQALAAFGYLSSSLCTKVVKAARACSRVAAPNDSCTFFDHVLLLMSWNFTMPIELVARTVIIPYQSSNWIDGPRIALIIPNPVGFG
jgi:hypothetical protein